MKQLRRRQLPLRVAVWMGLVLAGIGLPAARALTPYLVKDINPNLTPASSSPRQFVALGGAGLFIADGDTGGPALWRSDGTEEGTYPLLSCDGCVAGYPRAVAYTDSSYFFSMNPRSGGTTLWVTSGTRETTVRLGVFGFNNAVADFGRWVPGQGLVYFAAHDEHGVELWRTDGSAAGTYMVTDLAPGPSDSYPEELTDFGGQLFFSADDGNGRALWTTDGTASGTQLVKNTWPGNPSGRGPYGEGPAFLNALAGRLVFVSASPDRGNELWRSDGTPEGTVPLRELVPGPESPTFYSFRKIRGRRLLFLADDGSGPNVWVTNGLDRGTRRLTSLAKGTSLGPYFTFFGPVLDGRAFFAFDDGEHGTELWTSDGTEAGTYQVSDVCPGPCSSNPLPWLASGGRLFFTANDGIHGEELWSTDGSAEGTSLVKDVCPGACGSHPAVLAVVGRWVLFQADDGRNGPQIWRTDGTPAGTLRVSGFAGTLYGIDSFFGAALPDLLLFAAPDSEHGTELWATNGTRWGTRLVKDIATAKLGGSRPQSLTAAGNRLFFFADDGVHGYQLWTSDGTDAGTVLANDFGTGQVSGWTPNQAAAVGETLFFAAASTRDDLALWKSDGTPGGTVRLTKPGVRPQEVVAVGATVFFLAYDGQVTLWKSDGTEAGTVPVDPAHGRGSEARRLTAFQGRLYYIDRGSDGYQWLWRSDGTPEGTIQFVNLRIFNAPPLAELAGRLYFFVREDAGSTLQGLRLWSSDGTQAGTRPAASFSLVPGDTFSPDRLAVAGSRLFVFGTTGPPGGGSPVRALWVSDGTAAGTRLVRQQVVMPSGVGASHPPDFVDFNGRLVFVGAEEDSLLVPLSATLWASDGTPAGTAPLLDAGGKPIVAATNPRVFAGLLLFAAPLPGADLLASRPVVWQSDGTPAGTAPLFPLDPGAGIGGDLVVAGPRLFVSAYEPRLGTQLWALRAD